MYVTPSFVAGDLCDLPVVPGDLCYSPVVARTLNENAPLLQRSWLDLAGTSRSNEVTGLRTCRHFGQIRTVSAEPRLCRLA
jgi:hypothetical protein